MNVIVDIDLEKFFDKVNHDMLMHRVARVIKDKRVLKLIRAYLKAGAMENSVITRDEWGTPQGGPLSPLLSNIMLDDLDKTRQPHQAGNRQLQSMGICQFQKEILAHISFVDYDKNPD